ncbi:MAG TPA: hypothetical protein VHC48_03550, partial [Puia sp.]|nr:hypothetical protein [Puia sp.]
PFKMWLYPLPVILSIVIWVFVWVTTGRFALYGLTLALIGIVVYFLTKDRWKKVEGLAGERGEG